VQVVVVRTRVELVVAEEELRMDWQQQLLRQVHRMDLRRERHTQQVPAVAVDHSPLVAPRMDPKEEHRRLVLERVVGRWLPEEQFHRTQHQPMQLHPMDQPLVRHTHWVDQEW